MLFCSILLYQWGKNTHKTKNSVLEICSYVFGLWSFVFFFFQIQFLSLCLDNQLAIHSFGLISEWDSSEVANCKFQELVVTPQPLIKSLCNKQNILLSGTCLPIWKADVAAVSSLGNVLIQPTYWPAGIKAVLMSALRSFMGAEGLICEIDSCSRWPAEGNTGSNDLKAPCWCSASMNYMFSRILTFIWTLWSLWVLFNCKLETLQCNWIAEISHPKCGSSAL